MPNLLTVKIHSKELVIWRLSLSSAKPAQVWQSLLASFTAASHLLFQMGLGSPCGDGTRA